MFSQPFARRMLSLFLLSAATLAYEISLTRLFSVAQFYHFAFLVVSLALLGTGASGTYLALTPLQRRSESTLALLALLCGGSILAGYLFTNFYPFDSFTLAWDASQVLLMAANFLALAAPFFFNGLVVSLLLAQDAARVRQTYTANLGGAAFGCLLGLASPGWLGGEGVITLSAGLAGVSALSFISALANPSVLAHQSPPPVQGGLISSGGGAARSPSASLPGQRDHRFSVLFRRALIGTLCMALVVTCGVDLFLRLAGQGGLPGTALRLSPYKSLSYTLQLPGAEQVFQRWNAFSRVDLVRSPIIRSLPGLSYRFTGALPRQHGLTVDGDDLSAVLLPAQPLDFAAYLPSAAAFRLRPGAEALILDPAGGVEIFAALANGAGSVTAAQPNDLIRETARSAYEQPRVKVETVSGRAYLMRQEPAFDFILFNLSTTFHPVRSGAFSLGENYLLTLEGVDAALGRLKPGGLLVITRWLQTPPSEELRAFALVVSSLERRGLEAGRCAAAYRGYNTLTLLAKNGHFTGDELDSLRTFTQSRAYDLVYAPGIQPEETNQFNVLPESVYYEAFASLLQAQPRDAFYRAYPFDVSPPSDDRPFFANYFKWSQASDILREFGHTWQPFGGGGYFILLALLALSILFSGLFILLPVLVLRGRLSGGRVSGGRQPGGRLFAPYLLYFGCIGAAFMLVEIPLIQRLILFLDQPVTALAVVLFSLLLFSGAGSLLSRRIRVEVALALLVALLCAIPFVLPYLVQLGMPLALRIMVTILVLAPVGCLMGVAFPAGMSRIHANEGEKSAVLIPWVWAVNGSASVVSSVAAALLALSFGFTVVFLAGALCYAAAWLTWAGMSRYRPPVSGTKRTSPRL
jgi:hypothetical protein